MLAPPVPVSWQVSHQEQEPLTASCSGPNLTELRDAVTGNTGITRNFIEKIVKDIVATLFRAELTDLVRVNATGALNGAAELGVALTAVASATGAYG